MSVDTGSPYSKPLQPSHHPRQGNALVTPLVLQASVGGSDRYLQVIRLLICLLFHKKKTDYTLTRNAFISIINQLQSTVDRYTYFTELFTYFLYILVSFHSSSCIMKKIDVCIKKNYTIKLTRDIIWRCMWIE